VATEARRSDADAAHVGRWPAGVRHVGELLRGPSSLARGHAQAATGAVVWQSPVRAPAAHGHHRRERGQSPALRARGTCVMDRSVSTVLSADESAAESLAAGLESLLLARVRRAGLSTLDNKKPPVEVRNPPRTKCAACCSAVRVSRFAMHWSSSNSGGSRTTITLGRIGMPPTIAARTVKGKTVI
jgi:hypothetical protein